MHRPSLKKKKRAFPILTQVVNVSLTETWKSGIHGWNSTMEEAPDLTEKTGLIHGNTQQVELHFML